MNPFVNLNKRSVTLPVGCKDLIDVLKQSPVTQELNVNESDVGLIITAPGLCGTDAEITIDGNVLRLAVKKTEASLPFESLLTVPPGYDINRARALSLEGTLCIVIPKSNDQEDADLCR